MSKIPETGTGRNNVKIPAKINPAHYNAPHVMKRCAAEPSWSIQAFRINSDQIKEYLAKKLGCYVPGAKIEVQPRYIENRLSKKNKNDGVKAQSATTQSYASLLVAMSTDIVDHGTINPAFRWVLEGTSDVRIISGVYTDLIKRYSFNRESLKELSKDYQAMDHLKERFGITDEYMNSLISTCTPIRQNGPKGDDGWVIFAASADRILEDMLTEITVWEPKPELVNENDPDAPKVTVVPYPSPAGRMEIVRVNKISQDLVEFVVYLHLGEYRSTENPELHKLFESFK